MKVLGLDFETQDADPRTTRVTEVGAVLYHYEKNQVFVEVGKDPNDPVNHVPVQAWQKITHVSEFCYEPDYPKQTDFIVELTGITDEKLKLKGRPRKEVFEKDLLPLVEEADIIVAHKIDFDKTILECTAKLFNLAVPKKEWLCTLTNFPWPSKYTCHKLSHLAYDHSILVDPATLHRAVNDIELMMRLIAKYDFDEVLAYSREPWVYLKAQCAGPWIDKGVQTGIARSFGFNWERVKGTEGPTWPKTWVARTKTAQVQAILDGVANSVSPFRVARIEGIE